VGAFLIVALLFIPTAFFRPSVKASAGKWHEAHATVLLTDKRLSKNNFLPRLTVSALYRCIESYDICPIGRMEPDPVPPSALHDENKKNAAPKIVEHFK
jgi:hypothetical protein